MKYIIIDAEAIQKRIEELEKQAVSFIPAHEATICYKKLDELKQILSQSTPLIPEIEKAWEDGRNGTALVGNFPFVETKYVNKTSEDYILNLKLDI